jgi:hypothetical protein
MFLRSIRAIWAMNQRNPQVSASRADAWNGSLFSLQIHNKKA